MVKNPWAKIHTGKSFTDLANTNQTLIVITLFPIDLSLDKSEKCDYNSNLVSFNKIQKIPRS